MVSGLQHEGQCSVQPLKNTVVRIPGAIDQSVNHCGREGLEAAQPVSTVAPGLLPANERTDESAGFGPRQVARVLTTCSILIIVSPSYEGANTRKRR
jgi:hypothetical protein